MITVTNVEEVGEMLGNSGLINDFIITNECFHVLIENGFDLKLTITVKDGKLNYKLVDIYGEVEE